MKKVVLSITMLSVLNINAQTEPPVKSKGAVGINTHEPRATLDINGNLRLQEIKLMTIPNSKVKKFTECPCVFIIDQFGVVKRIPLSQLTNVGGGSGGGTGSTPPPSGGGGTGGSTPPSSGGGGTSGTPPSSGGGAGSANMGTTQTIYIPSIKDTGVDYQGVINNGAQKIRFTIPYTGGNNGTYDAVNTTVTSNVVAGENGDSNPLQLTIDSGTFSSSGGNITGTITVGGDGTLNVKKQKLPTSASDFEAKKLDVATINFKLGTKDYSLKIVGTSGVPDRCFGKTTQQCVGYGANVKEHEFIYIPITGPDGRTWLSNNLGAEYARVGSPWFNPTRQAGALDPMYISSAKPLTNPTADQIKQDWRAYGSLFQWQRNPDGHELINWSGSTSGSGTPKYAGSGSISNSWTNAGTNKFILDTVWPYSWVKSSLNSDSSQWNLWQTNGSTNPCPSGYHVPTLTEQKALHDAITGKSNDANYSYSPAMWNETVLRFPASGYRHSNYGTLNYQSIYGRLWSSELYGLYDSWYLWFNSSNSSAYFSDNSRTDGFSVRCLKD